MASNHDEQIRVHLCGVGPWTGSTRWWRGDGGGRGVCGAGVLRRLALVLAGVVLVASCTPAGGRASPATTAHPEGTGASVGSPAAGPPSSVPAVSAIPAPAGVAFGPGACVRFSPLRGNRHHVVFVDPGHGGPDTGALGVTTTGRQVTEGRLTLAIGTALLADLRAHGYTVVMARTAGGAVAQAALGDVGGWIYSAAGLRRDLQARVACANVGHADVLVSVHLDAFPDPAAGGSETVYDPDRPFAGQSLRLARLVQYDVLDSLAAAGWSVPDRGVLDDLQQGTAVDAAALAYGHLLLLGPRSATLNPSPSQMPGVVWEPLFITDPPEVDIATSRAGQQALARGLTTAVITFLTPPAPATSHPTHR